MIKKNFITFLLIALSVCSAILPTTSIIFASEKQSITYVAFGDSIAKGYAINLKTKSSDEQLITGEDLGYSPVEDCYVDKIKNELDKTYTTSAYNFSKSGDTCQDMIDFISGFYDNSTNTIKNAESSNSRFPSLTNEEVFNKVKNANVITVCIGANNILGSATRLIGGFLGIQTPTLTRAEIENELRDYILGSDTIKGLQKEFEELLEILTALNSTANIYFTNVYNPYKVLKADASLLSITSSFLQLFTQENLDIISEITETAIGGGIDSSGNNFIGINDVIESTINNLGNIKFKFIDSKSQFDAKYNTNPTIYNNYVNTQLENLTYVDVVSGNINITDFDTIASTYLDPHPTYDGHSILADSHIIAGLQVSFPLEDIFNYSVTGNGSTLQDSYSLDSKNSTLVLNANVTNADYFYTYTYKIKCDNEIIQTINSNTLTISFRDFNAGTYDIYLTITAQKSGNIVPVCTNIKITSAIISPPITYTVSFVTNCNDSVNPITVEQGETITPPTVSKENYTLIGWFTDAGFSNEWDFSTNTVNNNLTLYAKWQAIIYDITLDYNGGTLNSQSSKVISVMQNSTLNQPSEVPTLEKHEFIGWFKNLSDSESYNFSLPVTSSFTLYAKWEQNIFDVTFDFTGGVLDGQNSIVLQINSGNCVLDSISTSPNFTRTGYKFNYWRDDKNNKFDFATPITENITLYAVWEKIISINIYNLNENNEPSTYLVAENTQMSSLYNLVNPSKDNALFGGWFKDVNLTTKCLDDEILQNNSYVYIRWIMAICKNENLLTQTFSTNTQQIPFYINAPIESFVQWKVNGEIVREIVISNNNGENWNFVPTSTGLFNITCSVNGESLNVKTVEIIYSTPTEINIVYKQKLEKKYYFEVKNKQYYNSDNFVWLKADTSSNEWINIGTGSELEYTFDSNCRICVKYFGQDIQNELVSNIYEVKIEDHSAILFTIIVVTVIFAIIIFVVSTLVKINKNSKLKKKRQENNLKIMQMYNIPIDRDFRK